MARTGVGALFQTRAVRCLAAMLACAAVAALPSAASALPPAQKSVIGGRAAPLPQWGFTVAILQDGRFICTGSVIAPTKVLTAAHCASAEAPSQLTVVANRPRLGTAAVGEVIGVSAISVHPDYGLVLHDLAVLTLASPTSAPVIALPTPAEDAALTSSGSLLGIAGYGRRNPLIFGRGLTGVLQTTTERSRTNCARAYGAAFIPDGMVCALGRRIGRTRVHRSGCFGDSGGPLIGEAPSGPRLLGATSQGTPIGRIGVVAPCGGGKGSNLFARVAGDLPFINEALGTAPPSPHQVTLPGPPVVQAGHRIGFPVSCTVTCTLAVSMTLALGGPDLGPVVVIGTLAPGQVGFPYVSPNRPALRGLLRTGRGALVGVVIGTFGKGTPADTHTRVFGFR